MSVHNLESANRQLYLINLPQRTLTFWALLNRNMDFFHAHNRSLREICRTEYKWERALAQKVRVHDVGFLSFISAIKATPLFDIYPKHGWIIFRCTEGAHDSKLFKTQARDRAHLYPKRLSIKPDSTCPGIKLESYNADSSFSTPAADADILLLLPLPSITVATDSG